MRAGAPASALVVAVAAVGLVLGVVAPAAAHVELERSEPEAGAVLDTAPVEVFVRFTGDVEEGSITIRVVGPDGEEVSSGETQSGGRGAAVELEELTETGVYRVRYSGTAGDGHELEGRFRFRVRLDATGAPSPAPSAPPTSSATSPPATPGVAPPIDERRNVPWWPFAVLVGVAAVVGFGLFRRR